MKFIANNSEYIEIHGYRIFVKYYEYRKGRPFAMVLHGLRADVIRMESMSLVLAKHYNVIAFDFPGHGKSSKDIIFDNYTQLGKKVLGDIIKYFNIPSSELVLFGTSYGANVIIEHLIDNPHIQYERVMLYAPIFSKSYISMNWWYKHFVLWFTNLLSKKGGFYRFVQSIVNNDYFFKLFTNIITLRMYTGEELEYEMLQWRLMGMDLWGKSIQDFLSIDYNEISKTNNTKKIVFVFPHHDQYIDVPNTIKGFEKMFPQMVVSYIEGEMHVPKGDFSHNNEFLSSINRILEEAMSI